MRKIPFSILKRLNGALRGEYSLVKRQGLKWVLNKRNWIDNRLLCFRGYEQKNVRLIKQILNAQKFDGFFDIGANIGYFAVHVAHQNKVEVIHAFEPMARNYHQMCANLLVNNFSSRVTAHQLALSDKTAETTIHFNSESTGIATLNPSDTVRSQADYTTSEVIKAVIFDEMFDFTGRKFFIKMDVEQHEIPALTGMKKLFKNNKIAMILEINKDNEALRQMLSALGLKEIKADTDSDDYIFANFDLALI